MIDLLLKLLAALGVLLVFMRFPKYFNLGILNPRMWGRPDRQTLKKIALVSAFGLAISLVMFPSLDALSFQAGQVIDESHPQVVIYKFAPVLLLLVVASMPILEEWLFRGCLLRLFKEKKGPIVGILLSSALFGMFHVIHPGAYPLAFISPFFAGLVFGWCYIAQGLPSAVLTHSGYNVAIFALWWI